VDTLFLKYTPILDKAWIFLRRGLSNRSKSYSSNNTMANMNSNLEKLMSVLSTLVNRNEYQLNKKESNVDTQKESDSAANPQPRLTTAKGDQPIYSRGLSESMSQFSSSKSSTPGDQLT
jgi:hypothetical protein